MKDESKSDVFSHVAQELIVYKSDSSYENGGKYNESKELDKLCTRYKNALPDDIPVIPAEIGTAIKSMKNYHRDLFWAFNEANNRWHEFGIRSGRWIIQNQDTFAYAWVLGVWRVEETGEIVKLEEEK